jgi:Flp pilus assembly protein TadD
MWRPGSTDHWRAAALALTLLALAGCSAVGGGERNVRSDAGPPTALVERFDEAVLRLGTGDEAFARSEFQALAREYPDYAGPALNLALLHEREGKDAEALAWLAVAAERCARCGAVWNELGVIRRREGRFADAEQAYRRAIELEPSFGLAYYNLAVLYDLYLQRPQLALDFYRQYLDGAPDPELSAVVTRWLSDLERRVQAPAKAARAGEEG